MNDSEIVIRPRICKEFTDVNQFYDIGAQATGSGQHSTVYRAVGKPGSVAEGREVAMKVTKKKVRGIEHSIRKEMDALKKVAHNPHIMKFVDIHEDEGTFYTVLEWLGGEDLCARLTQCGGRLPDEQASSLVRVVLRCLHTIHGEKIMHRDVKLKNLMFTAPQSTCLKLIDFGAAEFIEKDKDITKSVGTQKYMPPEMFSRKPYGTEVDMWAVGVTAYTLLCGVEPFTGHGPALVNKIIEASYQVPQGFSRDARDFIKQCLQVKQEKRLKITDALNHPWVARPCDAFREYDMLLNPDVRKNVRGLKRLYAPQKWSVAGTAVRAMVRLQLMARGGGRRGGRRRISEHRATAVAPQRRPSGPGGGAAPRRLIKCRGKRYDENGDALCNVCNNAIIPSTEGVEAMDGFLHVDCFRCSLCNKRMEDRYVEWNGDPCHKACLEAHDASLSRPVTSELPTCSGCGKRIRGGIEWGGRTYHDQCFRCAECNLGITDAAVELGGEPYHHHCVETMKAARRSSFVNRGGQLKSKQHAHPPPGGGGGGGRSSISQSASPSPASSGGDRPFRVSGARPVDMRSDSPNSSPSPSPAPHQKRVSFEGDRMPAAGGAQGGPPASSPMNAASQSFLSHFCHECGNKHVVSAAKFCMTCGTKRL